MTVMALQDRIRKLTYGDYALIPDDGKRHEIIDGEHYVSPAPKRMHQRLVGRLFQRLDTWVGPLGLGEVYLAPFDVVLSSNDVVQPDLFFLSCERSEISTEDNLQGAPDLVIEILSESSRKLDEGIKLRRYEQFGAQEYWIVNGLRRVVTVYRLIDGAFDRQSELSAAAGDILTTPLLPGLEVSLAQLFSF